MMDDFDEMLASLGIQLDAIHQEVGVPEALQRSVVIDTESRTEPVSEEQTATILSDEDFSNILEENGFVEEPEDNNEEAAEAEEDDVHTIGEDLEEHDFSEELVMPNIEVEELDEEPEPEQEAPVIQPIPASIFVDESSARFSGADWYSKIKESKIIVAGIGGIGSNLCFQLSRLCVNTLCMYDDDLVETVNMSGQLFSRNDIGNTKVNAISNMIHNYGSVAYTTAIDNKFTETTTPGDIMMCGFDNMAARKIFYNSWYRHIHSKPEEERKNCLFIDGRLSMDTLQVLCITGDDEYNMGRYRREFLFTDEQADETICSMKQTTFMACMIASVMTNLFVNFTANLLDPVIPYDLPFFTEYDSQNMIFKTEQ